MIIMMKIKPEYINFSITVGYKFPYETKVYISNINKRFEL